MSIGEWRDDGRGAREWIPHAKEAYTDEELLKVLRGVFSTGRSIEKRDALIEAVARILERISSKEAPYYPESPMTPLGK